MWGEAQNTFVGLKGASGLKLFLLLQTNMAYTTEAKDGDLPPYEFAVRGKRRADDKGGGKKPHGQLPGHRVGLPGECGSARQAGKPGAEPALYLKGSST